MKTKMTVHNLMEAKVLIKESYARGEENDFYGTRWESHMGEFVCISYTKLTDFELVLPDMSSLIIEVDL
jgi:hypothetical protein